MNLTEDNIEEFIRANKDKFYSYHPDKQHEEKFIRKLVNKFKKFVNIVPYLLRVFIVTIIIFVVSIWIWNSYIRKDRNEITLKEKLKIQNITNQINSKKNGEKI